MHKCITHITGYHQVPTFYLTIRSNVQNLETFIKGCLLFKTIKRGFIKSLSTKACLLINLLPCKQLINIFLFCFLAVIDRQETW